MTLEEIQELLYGDEVLWTDPDDTCSKVITIRSVKIKGTTICITDQNGDYLECLASELS